MSEMYSVQGWCLKKKSCTRFLSNEPLKKVHPLRDSKPSPLDLFGAVGLFVGFKNPRWKCLRTRDLNPPGKDTIQGIANPNNANNGGKKISNWLPWFEAEHAGVQGVKGNIEN